MIIPGKRPSKDSASQRKHIKLLFIPSPRPDSSNSFDWFSERQTKILRYIRSFLQSNSTFKDPDAVNQTRIMYRACMNTGILVGRRIKCSHLNIYHLN